MTHYISITDLQLFELAPYMERSEVQLLRWNEPKEGLFVAETPNVILRALDAGYLPLSFLVEEDKAAELEDTFGSYWSRVPVYVAAHDVLTGLIGFSLTRGILCLLQRRPLPPAEDLLTNQKRIAILEDVMNPTNVGAIFRSAAALGVDGVYLTKGCSDPLYRRAARVSMGTVFQVPWAWLPEENWTDLLRERGFTLTAMALKEDSIPLDDPVLEGSDRLAVILGTESEGIREETLRKCDHKVIIPMEHGVDSLNVAAASAVAFWQLCRRK